jgi:hypothetical protein
MYFNLHIYNSIFKNLNLIELRPKNFHKFDFWKPEKRICAIQSLESDRVAELNYSG